METLENLRRKALENLTNVDKTIYQVFDKICKRLGYNPEEYTEVKEVWEIEVGEIHYYPEEPYLIETTYIVPSSFKYSLRRDLYSDGKTSRLDVWLDEILYDNIRRMLFRLNLAVDGWTSNMSLEELEEIDMKYNEQTASEEKIDEVVESLVSFLTS